MAFAPALEILIGSKIRYVRIMLFIAFVVGVCFSIAVMIGAMKPWPGLGCSGVAMGMIGLSAYLMNKAPNLGAFFVVMDKHDDNPAQKLLGMQRNNSV